VGYAEGRIVCTKNSAEKVMEFLKSRYNLEGAVVSGNGGGDSEA
jgi:hypothetical protein